MPKSSLVYDPQKLEFHRRNRGVDWEAAGIPSFEVPPRGAPSTPATPEEESGTPTSAESVLKPDGYVDPTPTRRKRRRRHASSRRESEESSSSWRGIMWVIILILGVLWAYMLYTQGRGKKEAPRGEEPGFIFNRDEVINGG